MRMCMRGEGRRSTYEMGRGDVCVCVCVCVCVGVGVGVGMGVREYI